MPDNQPWVSDQWYVSPYNFAAEVIAALDLPETVAFSDCTLREGEQEPGVVFTLEDKVQIARALDGLGVQQLEVGMPAVSTEERETIKAVANLGLRAKTIAVCRTNLQEIDAALECGVWGVIVSIPFGELQIKHKLGWSYEMITKAVLEVTHYARRHGLYVILSPYDTTRARMDMLEDLLGRISGTGDVDRIRLVDTVGSASPQAIAYLVRKIKACTGGMPVEVHCHDDFGLATANTLAGVGAGAEVVSTTVNGMGERSGGAATEEVAMSLRLLYGLDPGLDLSKLYEISRLVQELSGVQVQPHKAVVGQNSFAQEAGLVVGGLIKFPFTAEPYLPEVVGQRSHIVLGKKSGKSSIKLMLERLKLKASEVQVQAILERVKTVSQQSKVSVSEEQFYRLAQEILGEEGEH